MKFRKQILKHAILAIFVTGIFLKINVDKFSRVFYNQLYPTKTVGIVRKENNMILSTKGRYGLKAVFELSLNYGLGPVSLKTISKKYEISESYLEQLFAKLRKDGYIDTVRGPLGGYFLAKDPKEITVGMILRTLEGDITTSECLNKEVCSREAICATRVIFEKIENSINNVIDNITLADMYEERKNINMEETNGEKDLP